MSYFYPFYNCITIVSQPIYSIYTQMPLTTTFQPFILRNLTEKPQENNPTRNIQTLQSIPSNQDINASKLSQPALQRRYNLKKKRIIKKKKDQSFGWRKQNKDRNQISNILKSYMNYILQDGGMLKFIEQTFKLLKINSDVSKFYDFLLVHFAPEKTYIGLKYMSKILNCSDLDSSMLLILKKTLKMFLHEIFPLSVITVSKSNKKSKISILSKARQIKNTLFII